MAKMTGRPVAAPVQEKSNTKAQRQALKQLWQFMRPYHKKLYLTICFSFLATIISLIGPNRLSRITDLIIQGLQGQMDLALISQIGLLLISLYLLAWAMNSFTSLTISRMAQKLNCRMRQALSDKFARLPLSYTDRQEKGDIMSRVVNDADAIGQSLTESAATLVSSLVLLVGVIIMMFYTNWALALASLLTTSSSFVLAMLVMNFSGKYFKRRQELLGELNAHMEETFNAHQVVQAFRGEQKSLEKFEKVNQAIFVNNLKANFWSSLIMPIMIFTGNLAYVVVCILGCAMVISGSISFGTIVAFVVYSRLFMQPMQNLSQAATSFQNLGASAVRVFDLLNQPEMEDERNKTLKVEQPRGEVEFQNVRFSYVPGKEIIHGFSAHVLPGQKVAIVGQTGAGKTTMVNLLMRFYEIDSGSILLDGVDMKSMSREAVHDLFSMVLQETWVFDGTLRENMVFNQQEISEENLVEVCHKMGIWELVEQLPDGLDSLLSEKTALSQGQKQLITLARAMVRNAPLLILDEATSSVDTRTELQVQRAMDHLMEGRTSFVIAHRLSTIQNADLILVMREGDIVESGTHEELLQKPEGYYAELYNSQFSE